MYQIITLGTRHMYSSRNKASFYGEDLSALRPTSKSPLLAVREYLFKIFAAPPHTGAHSQPDAPCRGDRDQLTMVAVSTTA